MKPYDTPVGRGHRPRLRCRSFFRPEPGNLDKSAACAYHIKRYGYNSF